MCAAGRLTTRNEAKSWPGRGLTGLSPTSLTSSKPCLPAAGRRDLRGRSVIIRYQICCLTDGEKMPPDSTSSIYLDYNATTPLDPRVLEEMTPYLVGNYGNPSSIHSPGSVARAAVDSARERVSDCLGVRPGEIVFTSGGSESNNFAIKGLAYALSGRETTWLRPRSSTPRVLRRSGFLNAGVLRSLIFPWIPSDWSAPSSSGKRLPSARFFSPACT